MIITLFAHYRVTDMIQTPNPSQTAEQLMKLSQAPLDNLVAIVAIFSVCAVIGVGILIWKFAPFILKQVQQQIEINKQQASILDRLTTQSETAQKSANANTSELVKQTEILSDLTAVTKEQKLDFKNYQTLVSDNMSNQTEQIAINTEEIAKLRKELTTSIDSLVEKIDGDKESVVKILTDLKLEITELITQQAVKQTIEAAKRQTGTLTAAVIVKPEGKA